MGFLYKDGKIFTSARNHGNGTPITDVYDEALIAKMQALFAAQPKQYVGYTADTKPTGKQDGSFIEINGGTCPHDRASWAVY